MIEKWSDMIRVRITWIRWEMNQFEKNYTGHDTIRNSRIKIK